jgi:hypothetical protein
MRSLKLNKLESFNTLFLTALAIILAASIWRYRNIQVDDAFITYRYARNIAHGLGFAYNPPWQVLGTTTPLYALILAGASLLGFDIPFASLLLGGTGLFAIALIFHWAGRQQGRWLSTYLPALLVVLIPGSVLILGMETAFYTALAYLAFHTAASRRHTLAATIAAAATLTRYDGVLAAGIVLFYEWYAAGKFPLKRGLLYAALLAPWLLYATLTFGSPLPNTFFAKTGEFTGNIFMGGLPSNLFTLLGFFSLDTVPGWLLAFGVVIVCLAGFFVVKNNFIRLASAWCGLYLVAYALLGIRYTFHWYYYPLLPAFLMVLVTMVQVAQQKLGQVQRIPNPGQRWLLGQSLAILLVLPLAAMALMGSSRLHLQADTLPALGGRNTVYRLAAEWLCQHTDEQAAVAVPEIGLIGWYCDRPIIDPFGLVSPEMIPFIQRGDKLGGVIALRPDVIVITNVPKNGESPTIPEPDRFADDYEVAHVIEEPNYPYFLVIFEKSKSQ